MAREYHQGKFSCRNPNKYVGDASNIVFRSSWELKLMIFLDTNPSIIKWSSEEIVIPYINKVDNKPHRYFVDFAVQYRTRSGEVKKMLVEVKPKIQTKPPKVPTRKTKRYMTEVATYVTNTCKWEAATVWAKKNGFDEFRILTEDDLAL